MVKNDGAHALDAWAREIGADGKPITQDGVAEALEISQPHVSRLAAGTHLPGWTIRRKAKEKRGIAFDAWESFTITPPDGADDAHPASPPQAAHAPTAQPSSGPGAP